jgi:hypothetical protein
MDMKLGAWNVRSTCMYRAGSLRPVEEEILKYNLDYWEYRRSDGTEVAPNQQVNIHFSTERVMRIMN